MLFRTTSSKLLAILVLVLVLTLAILIVAVVRKDSQVRIDTFAAQTVSDASEEYELQLVDAWIADQNLNQYGDPEGTIYAGGDPLLSRVEGSRISLLDYLRSQHPDEPWKSYSDRIDIAQ